MENTQELFKELVNQLGDGWQYSTADQHPAYTGCTVAHPSGWSFTLHHDSYNKKIEVWGDFPRTELISDGRYLIGNDAVLHGDEYPKRIYISSAKSTETIAKDIKRRFLPAYEQAYNLATERIAERKINADKTTANMEMLAGVLGRRTQVGDAGIHWSTDIHGTGYHWADFEVNQTTVTIKANSLPMHKALAIAKILAEK